MKYKFRLTIEEVKCNNYFNIEFITETNSLADAYIKCYEYINNNWCGPDAWVNSVTYVGKVK